MITRGLDPDKAFGGPPGISLFKRDAQGRWSEQVIAWPRGQDLLPAETDHNPVGWSIHGDPVLAAQETQEAGLNVLELRPKEPTYDITATREIVNRIRDERSLYLSWHLPSLSWDEDKQTVVGQEEILRQTEDARSCGLDALTIHVPQVGAHRMTSGNDPWLAFLSAFETCFKSAAESGVRISIENVHNNPGTPVQREHRKYATLIDEYLEWIDAIRGAFGTAGSSVGAHFDVGHARNNGELGNIQPLGDWYARIGDRITGYHIHQVRPHEETRKLTNHRDIRSLHDRTVSYAGFLHAWSARMINRAPLFVEVRIAGERRRTTRMLRDVFLSTDH